MKEKELNPEALKKAKQQPDNSKRLVWLVLIVLVAATSVGNLFRGVSRVVGDDVRVVIDHEIGPELDLALEEVEREMASALQELEAALAEAEAELETAELELDGTELEIERAIREEVIQEIIQEIQQEIQQELEIRR